MKVVLLLLLSLALAQVTGEHRKVTVTGELLCAAKNGAQIPIEDGTLTLFEQDIPWPTFMSTSNSTGGRFNLHGEDTELFHIEFYLRIDIPCSKESKTRQNCAGIAYQKICDKGKDYYSALFLFEERGFFFDYKKDSYNIQCVLGNRKVEPYDVAIICLGGGRKEWEKSYPMEIDELTPLYNPFKADVMRYWPNSCMPFDC